MPRGLDPRATAYALEAPAATEWLRLLRCANRSGWSLLSLPDHSAPVNTAFLVVKPSRALYLEGIAALHPASSSHSGSSQREQILFSVIGHGRRSGVADCCTAGRRTAAPKISNRLSIEKSRSNPWKHLR